MPKQKVIVTGDKKLDAKLRKLGNEKLAKSIVRKSIRAALKPMLAAAKANTPKREGTLRKAIKIQSVRSRKGIRLDISILAKNLGPTTPGQAAAVEFGTEHQAPQAPMRRAFDAGATSARDNCLAAVKTGILDAAKG